MNPLDDLRDILDPGERMDTTTLYGVAAKAYLDLRALVVEWADAYDKGEADEWHTAGDALRKAVGL